MYHKHSASTEYRKKMRYIFILCQFFIVKVGIAIGGERFIHLDIKVRNKLLYTKINLFVLFIFLEFY